MPARLCGYVGSTILIYQRTNGEIYCNYMQNNSCNQETDLCRLRDIIEEHGGG